MHMKIFPVINKKFPRAFPGPEMTRFCGTHSWVEIGWTADIEKAFLQIKIALGLCAITKMFMARQPRVYGQKSGALRMDKTRV